MPGNITMKHADSADSDKAMVCDHLLHSTQACQPAFAGPITYQQSCLTRMQRGLLHTHHTHSQAAGAATSPPQRTQQGPLHELQTWHRNKCHGVALNAPHMRAQMVSVHRPHLCTGLSVLAQFNDIHCLKTMLAGGPLHAHRQVHCRLQGEKVDI